VKAVFRSFYIEKKYFLFKFLNNALTKMLFSSRVYFHLFSRELSDVSTHFNTFFPRLAKLVCFFSILFSLHFFTCNYFSPPFAYSVRLRIQLSDKHFLSWRADHDTRSAKARPSPTRSRNAG